VQLEEVSDQDKLHAGSSSFNSILVQLEADGTELYAIESDKCFNSILVQLEVSKGSPSFLSCVGFQFHIGAIRSAGPLISGVSSIMFQFHIGAIRSSIFTRSVSLILIRFNSILVQLEASHAAVCRLKICPVFQFHIGAIRSLIHRIKIFQQSCFNSILVQLEVVTQCA